jgi:hypothetical protein
MPSVDLPLWEVMLNQSLEHRDLKMFGPMSEVEATAVRLGVSPIHFKLLQRLRDSCEVHDAFLEWVRHRRRKFARLCSLVLHGNETNYEHLVQELTHVMHMTSIPCMRTEMLELVGTRDRLSKVIAALLFDERRRKDERRALGTWEDGMQALHDYYS